MSVETESKIFTVNGRQYVVNPWPAWTGVTRGLKIMNVLGPVLEKIPSIMEAFGGTDKQQEAAAVKLMSAAQAVHPELTVSTMKELCEGVMSKEKNSVISVETYFNEFPDDLFMVVFHSAAVQLRPFLPASIRALFLKKKASLSPKV